MNGFLIYLLGWIVFIVCYYIYYMYIEKDGSYTYKYNCNKNKKLILYHGVKYGIFSWFGIFGCAIYILVTYIIYILIYTDEWIEDKLK